MTTGPLREALIRGRSSWALLSRAKGYYLLHRLYRSRCDLEIMQRKNLPFTKWLSLAEIHRAWESMWLPFFSFHRDLLWGSFCPSSTWILEWSQHLPTPLLVSSEICTATGITYITLDHWVSPGVYKIYKHFPVPSFFPKNQWDRVPCTDWLCGYFTRACRCGPLFMNCIKYSNFSW